MHELSIALDLVELACAEAERLGQVRVHALHLRVGALSGIAREALLFCFDMAAAGTVIEGATLEIEIDPVVAWCSACAQKRVLASEQPRRCPTCDELTPRLLSGDGITLVSLEVVDAATAHC